MLNKNLLLLNSTINSCNSRFGDIFYEDEDVKAPSRIYPYINDHRILKPRLRTLLEMKPAFLFDAHTLNLSDGAAVESWASVVSDDVLTQSSSGLKPTFIKYGLANRPCVLFDGGDLLEINKSLLNNTTASIIVVAEWLAHDTAASQVILACGRSDSDDYYWILRSRPTPYISTAARNNGTETGFFCDSSIATGVQVILMQSNEAGNGYEVEVNGVQQTLTPYAGGTLTRGPSTIDGLNRTSIGAWHSTGIIWYLKAKIGLIAGWNRRI